MSKRAGASREPLSRDRILETAVAIADADGIEALSMRRLGQALSVEAMSLYKHVANKDDLLNGIADRAVAEVELPGVAGSPPAESWVEAMRRRSISMYRMIRRHPWAAALMESATSPGPDRLQYMEWLLRTVRDAGFSLPMTFRALMTIDGYIYGFTIQEQSWSFDRQALADAAAEMEPRVAPGDYPRLAEMVAYAIGPLQQQRAASNDPGGFLQEFTDGLDLILAGLDQMRDRSNS